VGFLRVMTFAVISIIHMSIPKSNYKYSPLEGSAAATGEQAAKQWDWLQPPTKRPVPKSGSRGRKNLQLRIHVTFLFVLHHML